MGIIISLLMNAAVAYTAWLLVSRVLAIKGCVDIGTAWFLLYFSQIVLSELLPGIFGILRLPNVILFNVFILLFVWLIARRTKPSFEIKNAKRSIFEFLNSKLILLFFSVIAGFSLVKIYINLVNPPFGWDCFNYHFVFPVEWFKQGNLCIPISIADDPSAPYYPINGSLYFLWLMMPFKNVFLADLGQVPFFLLAFLSLYGIARKIGIGKNYSFYAAALFIFTPNIFRQMEIAYVDVMLAALFFSSINFLLLFYEAFTLSSLVCFSLSFGLFLGIKTSAIVYGVFPFIFFVIIIFKGIKKVSYFKKRTAYLGLFFFITAVLGGFSYIRSLALTGNPLFPADIAVLGKNIFKGVMPFSGYRSEWTSDKFNLARLLFHEGMGLQFIVFVFPSLFAGVPFLLHKVFKKHLRLKDLFIVLLPLFLWFSFLFLMPQLWVRYLYVFVGPALILSFYMLETVKAPAKIVKAVVFICLAASMFEVSRHIELVASIVLSVFIFYLLSKKIWGDRKIWMALALAFFFSLHVFNIDYSRNEFKNYLLKCRFPQEEREAWFWLSQNTDGSKIAYAGRPDVLPLYGSNFKNDVLYVSVNKVHPVKLHDFLGAKYVYTKDYLALHKNLEKDGHYREKPDYHAWLKNMRSEDVDLLLIYSLNRVEGDVFPIEEEWARNNPQVFSLVFSNNSVRIYKVL